MTLALEIVLRPTSPVAAIAFPAAIATRPAKSVRRAPKRSPARPPAICIPRWTTNCDNGNRPTVATTNSLPHAM